MSHLFHKKIGDRRYAIGGRRKKFSPPISHILLGITQRGFTLIELLLVIAIIGLLAGLLVVNLNKARLKARDNRRQADISALANALEMYYATNKTYPLTSPSHDYAYTALSGVSDFSKYLSPVPRDPLLGSRSNPPPGWSLMDYGYGTNGGISYIVYYIPENQDIAITLGQSDPTECRNPAKPKSGTCQPSGWNYKIVQIGSGG